MRISTELVQTDVMVFDKDGSFVPGLKREQFELLVEGQPQSIDFFESIVSGGRNEGSALRAARDNKPLSGESDESVRGRTILFFINDLHLSPSSISRTHKTITNFINQMMGPEDQVAITSASGQIGFLQQLTSCCFACGSRPFEDRSNRGTRRWAPAHERLRRVPDRRKKRSRAFRLFCRGHDEGQCNSGGAAGGGRSNGRATLARDRTPVRHHR